MDWDEKRARIDDLSARSSTLTKEEATEFVMLSRQPPFQMKCENGAGMFGSFLGSRVSLQLEADGTVRWVEYKPALSEPIYPETSS